MGESADFKAFSPSQNEERDKKTKEFFSVTSEKEFYSTWPPFHLVPSPLLGLKSCHLSFIFPHLKVLSTFFLF